jgi:hypothetical protein
MHPPFPRHFTCFDPKISVPGGAFKCVEMSFFTILFLQAFARFNCVKMYPVLNKYMTLHYHYPSQKIKRPVDLQNDKKNFRRGNSEQRENMLKECFPQNLLPRNSNFLKNSGFLCITRFNIKKILLSAHTLHVCFLFCMNLRTSSNYVPIHH